MIHCIQLLCTNDKHSFPSSVTHVAWSFFWFNLREHLEVARLFHPLDDLNFNEKTIHAPH